PQLVYPNIAVVVITVVTAALLAYLFYALVRPRGSERCCRLTDMLGRAGLLRYRSHAHLYNRARHAATMGLQASPQALFKPPSSVGVLAAHLFNEIAQTRREREIASQHKSQFVANMSHELRARLAA